MPEALNPYMLAPYKGRRPPAPAWFERAVDIAPERSRLACNGAQIELLTWGERGGPGLLFLHGNGAHADWWSHIAPFFAQEWRCAAPSYSGMGRSDRRPAGYTIADFAQEALAAARVAGLDEGPCAPIIISHSFGGSVAIETAVTAGSFFGGVVTIDTPLNLDADYLAKIREGAPKKRAENRVFSRLEEGLASFRLSPSQECNNDFIADHIARLSLVEVENGWTWHFDPRRVTFNPELALAAPRQLPCPAAFIFGEKSALVTAQTLPGATAILPPGTPVIAIPDAAHHVMVDQPLALVATLRSLLATWPRGNPNLAQP